MASPTPRHVRRSIALLASCAALALVPVAAGAGGARPTFAVHGYGELQVRTLGRNFDPGAFVPSQWAHVLALELESDLAPDGLGPFEVLSAFARVDVRYDCIYNGCGVAPTGRWWGNSARRAPRSYTTGLISGYTGEIRYEAPERLHRDNRIGDYSVALSAVRDLVELGSIGVEPTFAPVSDALFAMRDIDASIGRTAFGQGPWNLDARVDEVGSLETVPNPTLPLPLRPRVPAADESGDRDRPHGLFVPSAAFLELEGEFVDPEQSFSEKDLIWNHGQGQDERELKEAYLDVEMFEGRLWLRVGKQSIVWGKTELFRTTDQFNPQDLALSSLPSLEESRLALWSARGTWSFYDVGPLEDLRLELAVNFDDFEPLDLGRCGEPYTVWLVCGKTFGLWAHGVAGAGIAGELRPDDPWDDPLEGLEFGARVEWRWRRFSFQLSDFYGYDDAPVVDAFAAFERRVDVETGRPLDAHGQPLLSDQDPADILRLHPGNRQLFDVACSATVGIAATVLEPLADNCLVDLLNSDVPIIEAPRLTPAEGLGAVFGGSPFGEFVAGTIAEGLGAPPLPLVELNQDPNDGPGGPGPFGGFAVSAYLTDQQEALLGCGRFYGTHCDVDGIDLFNAEASVLVQSFPQFEPGGAVATRPSGGLPLILPGAHGPEDDVDRNGIPDRIDPSIPITLRYDPLVDGCVADLGGPCALSNGGAGARTLVDPTTGATFRNEMAALSYNFLVLVAAISAGTGNDPDCDVDDPITCKLVRGVFGLAGSTRPEVRAGGNGSFGRRDFIWLGGAELAVRYERRNVLGFAFDFAEDRSKTNWSIEATWFHDQPFAVVDRPRGWEENDTFNLTISVDRPTFIDFLNPGRTFFMNSQWFVRYIHDHRDDGHVASGPVSVLGTFTVVTGYHQDRLLPSLTWVHDLRSTSGGVIGSVTYRFSTEFSATVGIAGFYGRPSRCRSRCASRCRPTWAAATRRTPATTG